MFPLSFRFLSLTALGAVALVACGNISLSSSNASPSGSSGVYTDSDAAADTGPIVALMGGDAGVAAPAVTGSPLCNYGFANTSAHTCVPDSDDAGAQQCLDTVADAAPQESQTTPRDAGGDNGGDSADAGTGVPVASSDAGAAVPPPVDAAPQPTPACHVVEQTGTDGGAWVTQTCTIAGSGQDGAQCQASTDCAATFECVGMPGQCRHYCCAGNTVCDATASPSFCDVQPVVSGKFNVPVCMPISGCALFGTCPTNQTCAVVKDDGTTSCVEVGEAGVGNSCDETHCAAGLTCLGNPGARTCFQLCHVDLPADCPAGTTCSGSAQLSTNPQFGICQ